MTRYSLSSVAEIFARPIYSPIAWMWSNESSTTTEVTPEPLTIGGVVARQSSRTTCGAMAGVIARAVIDDAFRADLEADPGSLMQRELEATRELAHLSSLPFRWPQWWGTYPTALADYLSIGGQEYWATPVDGVGPRTVQVLQWAYYATAMGWPVPLYTGGTWSEGFERALPRHVVVALPPTEPLNEFVPELRIYEPDSGGIFTVPVSDLVGRTRPHPAFGHWTTLAWAVLPLHPMRKKEK